MTYIEFFDKTAAENVCAALVNPPDKVIFVGGSIKHMVKCIERYKKLFLPEGMRSKLNVRESTKMIYGVSLKP